MNVTYRPGQWNALVNVDTVIVLPPRADATFVAEIWDGMRDAHELGALVDLLTLGSGGTLAGLPDFVAIATTDGANVRVAVRGVPEVTVDSTEGETRVSGRDVTTWSERLIRSASRIRIAIADEPDISFPIIGGVVRAAALTVELVASEHPIVPVAPPVLIAPSVPIASPVLTAPPVSKAPPIPEETLVTEEIPVAEESPVADEDPDTGDTDDTLMPEQADSTAEVDDFDLLFGDTVHVIPAGSPIPDHAPGDHDGATISLAQARALRDPAAASSSEAPTVAIPVASVGRIRLSTGQSASLDRPVIIGRRPRSTRASGANLPHLIAVDSPQQDISRNHLEVRPEGDTVVVIDLHTTNGSTLLRPGADPMRLHPGEQVLVLSGDAVDLGDGVIVTFEDLP
ncbi:FHA domain-containing protein [Microbacterium sp. A93]|uniref:FHA domain-containing protein n=1 Tax=Microbacterium sp. A93 TaxID=3450716 RepID=UPI003F41E024